MYRRCFIVQYLDEWQKVAGRLDAQFDTVDHVLWETDILGLVHALFLLSWWLVPTDAVTKDPTFLRTFIGMGQTMLKSYMERKAQLQSKIL